MSTLADAIATPSSININPSMGEQTDAASKSVVLSTGSKALLTALGTKLDSVVSSVDGLEALGGLLNSYVDGLETLQATLNGYVDGLETLATATNTKLDSLITQGASTAAVPVAQADEYETVAASQTDQVMGATGATGDRLSGILINPATVSPGNVIIKDGSTTIYTFTGGASSVSNLATIPVPLGIKSVSGAWKITTGTNVSVVAIGDFS